MSVEEAQSEGYSDEDKDSLHILPLAIIPLKTPGMRRPRLLKNARLETVVELFNEGRSGSGQIDISGLDDFFDASSPAFIEDRTVIEALATAPSFDVYSLRLTLRAHNIEVDKDEHLQLSSQMQERLTEYMRVFTRPLVQRVFGDDTRDVSSAAEIFEMFRGVDRDEALKRIRAISDALGLEVDQIPSFLEDYGDIFLSLSYFKKHLEEIRPVFERMKEWMNEGIKGTHLHQNKDAMRSCEAVESQVGEAVNFVLQRFRGFDDASLEFWKDLSKSRYTHLRSLIQNNHHSVGGVLCGLSVKFARWEEDFPREGGSPNKRTDWLLAEMVPGLDLIRAIMKQAPSLEEFGNEP